VMGHSVMIVIQVNTSPSNVVINAPGQTCPPVMAAQNVDGSMTAIVWVEAPDVL